MSQYDNVANMALQFGDGNDNPSGVGELGYFIPLAWFAANGIKAPTADTTAESLVTISTAHVLAAGKAAIPLMPLFDKSGITWKTAGEVLSKIFEQGAEVFIPSNALAVLGTVQALKNYRGIVLIRKLGTAHFYQIGSQEISAKVMEITGGTGVGPTGEVGSKVTFQSHSTSPVVVYTAGVPVPAP